MAENAAQQIPGADDEQAVSRLRDAYDRILAELRKIIVGMDQVIDETLIAIFCQGHVLLVGVPGLAKTLLVSSLAQTLSLTFKRIQFTPDLMPSDITGTEVLQDDPQTGERRFKFLRGPVFANIILADEINRTPPKTQAALLEAMQEKKISAGGEDFLLEEPFFVLATQNPIEQEGTYPLPEAQLDRFFFKLLVPYSNREELKTILDRTTTAHVSEVEAVLDGPAVLEAQQIVRRVALAPHVQDYAIRLVLATHPGGQFATETTTRFVRFGGSPRGVQSLVLGAKVRAMLDERYHVSFQDIDQSLLPAMRHRIIVNFEAQAEGITSDAILKDILEKTPKMVANA